MEGQKICFGAVGYKFKPTEKELVRDYLWNKVTGKRLPCDHLVKDYDVYGTTEPWDIWECHGSGGDMTEDLYFFTRLKKKSLTGERIQRRVGPNGGIWQDQKPARKAKIEGDDEYPCIAWISRRFCYENISIPMHHRRWIVQEYSLDPSMTQTDIVLCHLQKNQRKRKFSELITGA